VILHYISKFVIRPWNTVEIVRISLLIKSEEQIASLPIRRCLLHYPRECKNIQRNWKTFLIQGSSSRNITLHANKILHSYVYNVNCRHLYQVPKQDHELVLYIICTGFAVTQHLLWSSELISFLKMVLRLECHDTPTQCSPTFANRRISFNSPAHFSKQFIHTHEGFPSTACLFVHICLKQHGSGNAQEIFSIIVSFKTE
jgi:hypothetical protein